MTPLNRWKLISVVLAGCMSYSWWHGDAASTPAQAKHARASSSTKLRAAVLGMSKDELVQRLFEAQDLDEVRELAERLGAIGDDRTIDALMPLVKDGRAGVVELIVPAFGVIATDHAVDVLIELTRDARTDVGLSAVDALGATHNPRGQATLIEIAKRVGGNQQINAVYALAELATEPCIEALAMLAGHTDENASYAMRALAKIDKPAAHAALLRLVDSPSITVAADAIGELTEADLGPDMIAKLAGIIASGQQGLVAAALEALGKAGDAGLPILRQAALHGAVDVRITAINALGDSAQAIETLRTILDSEGGRIAEAAAHMLSNIDSEDAREALIAAAMADETGSISAVRYLMQQKGAQVEQALLVIAKSDSAQRWGVVEHLVSVGNADAMALAVSHARSGVPEHRLAAMEALADAATQPAFDALLEVVEHSGDLKGRALAIVGEARPDDPRVAKLLGEAVHSHVPGEAAAAARALAKVGTADARDALVAALSSSDTAVASSAAESLTKFRLTDEVTAALRSAVVAHPALRTDVMIQLVEAGSPVGVELAKQALGGDAEQAFRALSALEEAGTPEAFELIAQGTRVADTQVRAEAVATLGKTADKRAPELVAQALRDGEPAVRQAAARTLGAMGTPQARDLLISMTRSQDTDDRQAAVASLRRFEDAESSRRLSELVRDANHSVAYAAIDAVTDRADAMATLRGFLADANVSYDLRRQAATNLSYRGHTDPLIDDLLESHDD